MSSLVDMRLLFSCRCPLLPSPICPLLGRERSVITKHIGNAIKEGEIDEKRNVQCLHIANSDRPVKIYDLVDALEGHVVQIKQGIDYLVRQVTVPPVDSPMRKIVFVTDRRS